MKYYQIIFIHKLRSIEYITLGICVTNLRRNEFMDFFNRKLIRYKNIRLAKYANNVAIAISNKVFAA